MNGTLTAVVSYAVWGSIYELTRLELHNLAKQTAYAKQHPLITKFTSDATAASAASVVCSLFSYVRTMKSATEPGVTPSSAFSTIKTLFNSAKSQPTKLTKASFFFNSLKIGPSTARVAASMAAGQGITDLTKSAIN